MDLRAPPAVRPDPMLPMVNLVLLLLVFFLMVATLAPPAPVAVSPPRAAANAPPGEGAARLYLDAGGELYFGDATGEAALAAARAAGVAGLALHADRSAPAVRVAEVLAGLGAEAGPVRLVVAPAR